MNAVRTVYDQLPAQIIVPPLLQHRRVEVIMLPLDEEASSKPAHSKFNFAPIKVAEITIPSREERNARR